MIITDNVNGCVIGPIITDDYYRFYSEYDDRLLWNAGHFQSDRDAKKAFWDKFSVDPCLVKKYRSEGVEMRVWY